MKHHLSMLCGAALLLAIPAQSRDERLHLPIADAIAAVKATGKVDESVKLFFGAQKYPKPQTQMGTFTSNRKANFVGKSDKEACERAFGSVIIQLVERVKREGGNAMVDIVSVYRDVEFKSDTEYECGAGNITGGVALRGKVVKL